MLRVILDSSVNTKFGARVLALFQSHEWSEKLAGEIKIIAGGSETT
jgi:hypothetical protein